MPSIQLPVRPVRPSDRDVPAAKDDVGVLIATFYSLSCRLGRVIDPQRRAERPAAIERDRGVRIDGGGRSRYYRRRAPGANEDAVLHATPSSPLGPNAILGLYAFGAAITVGPVHLRPASLVMFTSRSSPIGTMTANRPR